jgi:hypothetical protein
MEIPLVSPVVFNKQSSPLPMDPYTFGFHLGSLTAKSWSPCQSVGQKGSWKEFHELLMLNHPSRNSLWTSMTIPELYLRASINSRLELLRGVFDSAVWTLGRDLESDAPQLILQSPSKLFSRGIIELVQSLGGTVSQSQNFHKRGEVEELLTVHIALNPFSLRHKRALFEKYSTLYLPQRRIVAIAKIRQDRAVCLSVSAPDRLYVTDHFVVTHNTIQAIASTAMYRSEWPVLVFTPSSARYHWKVLSFPLPHITRPPQAEVLKWLSPEVLTEEDVLVIDTASTMAVLDQFPHKFLIVSYSILSKVSQSLSPT